MGTYLSGGRLEAALDRYFGRADDPAILYLTSREWLRRKLASRKGIKEAARVHRNTVPRNIRPLTEDAVRYVWLTRRELFEPVSISLRPGLERPKHPVDPDEVWRIADFESQRVFQFLPAWYIGAFEHAHEWHRDRQREGGRLVGIDVPRGVTEPVEGFQLFWLDKRPKAIPGGWRLTSHGGKLCATNIPETILPTLPEEPTVEGWLAGWAGLTVDGFKKKVNEIPAPLRRLLERAIDGGLPVSQDEEDRVYITWIEHGRTLPKKSERDGNDSGDDPADSHPHFSEEAGSVDGEQAAEPDGDSAPKSFGRQSVDRVDLLFPLRDFEHARLRVDGRRSVTQDRATAIYRGLLALRRIRTGARAVPDVVWPGASKSRGTPTDRPMRQEDFRRHEPAWVPRWFKGPVQRLSDSEREAKARALDFYAKQPKHRKKEPVDSALARKIAAARAEEDARCPALAAIRLAMADGRRVSRKVIAPPHARNLEIVAELQRQKDAERHAQLDRLVPWESTVRRTDGREWLSRNLKRHPYESAPRQMQGIKPLPPGHRGQTGRTQVHPYG